MKKTIIGAVIGALWAFMVLAYALDNLKKANEEMALQINGYKLLLNQQELSLLQIEQDKRVSIQVLNEFLIMCVDGELIKISGNEYRCYLTYSM